MSIRRVWIVGAGKRVRETALPAFLSLADRFEVAGILARSSRDLKVGGARFAIRSLVDAQSSDFAAGDVVYVAVGKDAMPSVLKQLAAFDRARLELLIDTPVLKMKHLRHARLLEDWQRASVAEDVVHLPWFEALRAVTGEVRSVTFDRSAYAYHGIAQSKALCGSRLVRARRVKLASGGARRELEFENGARANVIEPRDYALGRVYAEGMHARVADHVELGAHVVALAPILEGATCVGIRAGDVETRFSAEEITLQGDVPPTAGVIARMESMKRIAFRRLAVQVADGRGAYSITDGLEDMSVDWFLERFGSWKSGGFRDLRTPAAMRIWSAIGRVG